MNSLVSVIIPNYNDTLYLRQSVESALAQTYCPVEVLVVVDGLADDSVHTIADFIAAEQVRLVRQSNQGRAAARNAGFVQSTGQFIVFLDSTDYLDPQMVARLADLVDARDPQLLAYCDYLKVSVSDEPLPGDYAISQVRSSHNGNILPQLLIQNYIQLHGVLVHRRLLESVGGFDQSLSSCEEYDLLLRLFCQGATARYLDHALAFYRQCPGISSIHRQHMEEATSAVVQAAIAHFPVQVAAALPAVVTELRHAAVQIWRGNQHWHGAYIKDMEAYVHSLRGVLAAREKEITAAKEYIVSLERAFHDVEAYARTLEAARSASQ